MIWTCGNAQFKKRRLRWGPEDGQKPGKKKMMATSVPPTQFGLKGPGGRPLAETTRWPHDLSVISEPLDTISGRRLLEDLAAWRLALIAVWYLSFLINLWPLCRWRRKKRIIEWSRFPPCTRMSAVCLWVYRQHQTIPITKIGNFLLIKIHSRHVLSSVLCYVWDL